jgi:hypothetical protein
VYSTWRRCGVRGVRGLGTSGGRVGVGERACVLPERENNVCIPQKQSLSDGAESAARAAVSQTGIHPCIPHLGVSSPLGLVPSDGGAGGCVRGSGCTPTPAPGYKAPTASTGSGTLVPPARYKATDTQHAHKHIQSTQTYTQQTHAIRPDNCEGKPPLAHARLRRQAKMPPKLILNE